MTESAATQSALYFGAVVHRRLRPRPHRLRYRVFSMLLDLDAADSLGLRLFSKNRFNLFSFHERDFGNGQPGLDAAVRAIAAAEGVDATGPLLLLFYPRLLGFAFNPLAVYYLHDGSSRPTAILYEVRNTFGEKHFYFIPVAGAEGVIRQEAEKAFYVSPFMELKQRYHFALTPPGARIAVAIRQTDAQGPILDASFTGVARPLDDATLAKAFFLYPLMTLKVVFGIHWEALKLLLKGVRYVPQTERHSGRLTVVRAERERLAA